MRFATVATLIAGAGLLVFSQSDAWATTITFTETLAPGDTNVFTLTVPGSGLDAPFTAALFHVGPPGLPGPIEIDLSGVGTWTIDLVAGLWYATVQTTADPPPEIRGQLVAIPEPATTSLLGIGLAIVILALARQRKHS